MKRYEMFALTFLAISGCHRSQESSFVDVAKSRDYAIIKTSFEAAPKSALPKIERLIASQPGNSLNHYLKAVCLVGLKDYPAAVAALKKGNALGACTHYVIPDTPERTFLGFVVLRNGFKQLQESSDPSQTFVLVELYSELRKAAKIVAKGYPQGIITLLMGARLQLISSTGSFNIYQIASTGPGHEAPTWALKRSKDTSYLRELNEAAKTLFPEGYYEMLFRKHGLTNQDMLAMTEKRVTPDIQKKLKVIYAELDAAEKDFVAKWLPKLPE